MKGNRIDLGLTGYNELFSSESSRNESKRPKIMDIPLSEIDDAPNHPFKVRIDEDMHKLVESIFSVAKRHCNYREQTMCEHGFPNCS